LSIENKDELFKGLLNNFLEANEEVNAVIVSDADGLIIAGVTRIDTDLEIVSVLTAIINPILERIRAEFAFKKFGTASFDTDVHRLLFILIDEHTTLSIVFDNMASVDKLSPYGYFLAEKCAQILTGQQDDLIQLTIPNFEYEAENSERMKNQIYQLHLDTGGSYRFKFIIIGEHEVGKTSLVRRFVEKKFATDYRATIGLNILSHGFKIFGNTINLSLWDVGAQDYFKRFRKTYYLGAQAAFIVFDLTKKETYEKVSIWNEELKDFINRDDLPIVIVGNKSDLEDQRTVEYQEGVQLANDLSSEGSSRFSYIETSALTGENVEDAFSLISYHYIMKSREREENRFQEDLFNEIRAILEKKETGCTLTFISENPFWSPGLQILNEMEHLGGSEKVKVEKEEMIYKYENGLTLKNYLYDNFEVTDSDGVFCIFDARQIDTIDPKWRDLTINIIETVPENKVVLIGIRISENIDWSQLMEEFNINEFLEKKMVSVLFFKIGEEYRLEIYDQLKVMLNTINLIG